MSALDRTRRALASWWVRVPIILVALGCAAIQFIPTPNTLGFAEGHSHVHIAGWIRDREDRDNTEGRAAFYGVLSHAEATRLVTAQHFGACERNHVADLSLLSPSHQRLPPAAQTRCLTGSEHGCVSWTYILDPSTDRLWLSVTYPDWGGTPACTD